MLPENNTNMFAFKINTETIFEDILLFLGLTLEFLFQGTIISQTGFICALAGGAWCMIRKRPISFKLCSFIVFYVLLIVYFGFRIAAGDSIVPNVSRAYLRTMCYCAIFMFFSYQYIFQRSLSEITSLLSLVCVAISMYLIFTGAIFSGNRMSSSGINANGLGIIMATTVSFVGFQIMLNSKKIRWSKVLFICWLILIVLLTGSRTSLFVCCVPLLIYFLFQHKRKIIIRVVSVLFILTVAWFCVMEIEALYDLIGVRLESMLEWFMTGTTDEASMSSRANFIELGMKYFQDRPWTGFGLFSFSKLPGSYGTYSHNNYVDMLVSGGIPALVLFYLPFLFLTISLLKRIKKDKTAKFYLFFVICALIMHMANVTFYTRIELFIYLVFFAYVQKARNAEYDE